MRWCTLILILMWPASWLRAGDLEDLQGYWLSLDDPWSLEIRADVATFRGEHMFYPSRNQEVKIRFSLDPEAKPRRIDLNADDFQAANKLTKINDSQKRAGVYRLIRDELTLQFFAVSFRSKDFDYWEGAPSNHARPMSRRLRRVSLTELRELQKLSGVWKVEIRDGKRTLFADSFFIEPGWLLCKNFQPCRIQIFPASDEQPERLPLLVHFHTQERGQGFLGGTFTTHHWLAGIGHLQPAGDRQWTGQLGWLYRDKKLDEAAFQMLTALDFDDVAAIRQQGRQAAQLPVTEVQLTLTKVADQIEYKFGHISGLLHLPTEQELAGDWQTIMRATSKELPGGKVTSEYAAEPRKERWTFQDNSCEIRNGETVETRIITRRKEPGGFVDVTLPEKAKQFIGYWNMNYEPQTGLLHVNRSERLDDVFIGGRYVLERVPATPPDPQAKP